MHQNPAYEPDYDRTASNNHPYDGPLKHNTKSSSKKDARERSPRRNNLRDNSPRSKDHRDYPSRYDPYAYREHMNGRPMYDTRDDPYFHYGGGMYPPMHGPWGYPHYTPWPHCDGYTQRDPYYMYDPMVNLMYPPRPPPRRGFYHDYHKRRNPYDDEYEDSRAQRVGFNEDVEEVEPGPPDPETVADVYRQKRKTRLGVLIILLILLLATIAMGCVATAMEPWWVQKSTIGRSTFTAVKVGLWETCYKAKETDKYDCHNYSKGKDYKSPYKSIKLLQWSMIVGTAVAFISLLFTTFAIAGRKSRFFQALLYTIIFFTIASTVLFGLVIAYVHDDKQATKLVSKWITNPSDTNLLASTMFYITCAVTACNIMSLILAAVLAFIHEPEPTKTEEEIAVYNENIKAAKKKNKENKSSKKKGRNSSADKGKMARTATAMPKNLQNEQVGNTPHYGEAQDKEAPSKVGKSVYGHNRPLPSNGMPPRNYTEKKDHNDTDRQHGHTKHSMSHNRPPAPPPNRHIVQSRIPEKSNPTAISPEPQNVGIPPQDKRRLGLELYGGDYDKYLNEPY